MPKMYWAASELSVPSVARVPIKMMMWRVVRIFIISLVFMISLSGGEI